MLSCHVSLFHAHFDIFLSFTIVEYVLNNGITD